MKKILAVTAACLAMGIASSLLGVAQPSGCPPLGFPCDPVYNYFRCEITTNWMEGVDFDGDRIDDFREGRFEMSTGCAGNNWHYSIVDKTAALFAVNGVEVYVFSTWGSYSPIVPEGQLIEMHPAPGVAGTWQWNPPGFAESASMFGFGYTLRTISQYPCGNPPPCQEALAVGWLPVTNPADFGFRIPHPGGWYLGWMRVEWVGRTPDGRWPAVQLVDYAVQPQPNTAIRAGERPRPPLSIALVEGRVRVSWPEGYPGFALERSRASVAGAWEPAPGVTNNAVLMEPADAPWYLRLRR
jgi:hypothetical protein